MNTRTPHDYRLLLVEESSVLRSKFQELLAGMGFTTVEAAPSLVDATDLLVAAPFDAIILRLELHEQPAPPLRARKDTRCIVVDRAVRPQSKARSKQGRCRWVRFPQKAE